MKTVSQSVLILAMLLALCFAAPIKMGMMKKIRKVRPNEFPKMKAGTLLLRAPHAVPLNGSFAQLQEYFVEISVEGQKQTVQVDTGSSDLGVPEGSCKCGSHTYPNWEPSSQAVKIKCSDRTVSCPKCSTLDRQCEYQISYEDGSGFSSRVYNASVSIGGEAKFTAYVGGVYKESSGFEPRQVDGILGMGPPNGSEIYGPSPFQSMSEQVPDCPNIFSICTDKQGGVMTLCGVGEQFQGKVSYTPLENYKQGFFNIWMHDLQVDGKSVGVEASVYNKEGGCTIDTGTSAMYVPKDAFNAIIDIIQKNCNNNYVKGVCGESKSNTILDGACFDLTAEDISKYPDLTVLAGKDSQIPIKVSGESYLTQGFCKGGKWTSNLVSNGKAGSLMGDPIFQSNMVVFDSQNMRLGFAPKYNCTL